MPIDLMSLHAAGAEVAGPHADAWLRMPGGHSKHNDIEDRVRRLHAQLGRRVVPGDLTGQPLPECAGGGEPSRPRTHATPHAAQLDGRRRLGADEVRLMQQIVEREGSRAAAARACGVNAYTFDRALAGESLMPDTIARLLAATVQAAPAAPPVAESAQPAAEPAQPATPEDPMPDALLTTLLSRLAAPGAKKAFAESIGRSKSCVCHWRNAGRIPEDARAAVETWLAQPPTAAVAAPAQRVAKDSTDDRVAAAKRAKLKADAAAADAEAPTAQPASPHLATITALCEALHVTGVEAWVRDGDVLRQVRAIVLP